MFAKFDEIPSMILEVIKETKRCGHTFVRLDGRSVVRSDGQRKNRIPYHKHSLWGYNDNFQMENCDDFLSFAKT